MMRSGILAAAALAGAGAWAADPGFVEDFGGGGLGNWFSGASLTNPGTGGVGGAGDGFLRLERTTSGSFAAATDASQYTGDLIADGVTGFSFWLNDIDAPQNFDIHICVGTAQTNFWIYNVSFMPPNNQWAFYEVNFNNPGDWTRVQGNGTFQDALHNTTRIQIRQDAPPFGSGGDPFVGELGIDRITVVPEPSSFAALALLAGFAMTIRKRRD